MRILRALMSNRSIGKLVDHYSRFSPSPLSMKQFIDFGKILRNNCLSKRTVKFNELSASFVFPPQDQKMRVRRPRSCSWERSCQSGWPTLWKRLTCCLITYSGRLQWAWCRAGECTVPHVDTHIHYTPDTPNGNQEWSAMSNSRYNNHLTQSRRVHHLYI